MLQNSSNTTNIVSGTSVMVVSGWSGWSRLSRVRQVEIIFGACLPGLLTLLGLIGNSLIIAVMKRKAFKSLPAQV